MAVPGRRGTIVLAVGGALIAGVVFHHLAAGQAPDPSRSLYAEVVGLDYPTVEGSLPAIARDCATVVDSANDLRTYQLCRRDVVALRDAATQFTADLKGVEVPAGLRTGDAALRDGLQIYVSAATMAVHGLDSNSQSDVDAAFGVLNRAHGRLLEGFVAIAPSVTAPPSPIPLGIEAVTPGPGPSGRSVCMIANGAGSVVVRVVTSDPRTCAMRIPAGMHPYGGPEVGACWSIDTKDPGRSTIEYGAPSADGIGTVDDFFCDAAVRTNPSDWHRGGAPVLP